MKTAAKQLVSFGPITAMIIAMVTASQAHAQASADAVARALAQGLSAEQAHDGATLLAQALVLDRLGAHPAEGENLAKTWLAEARSWGATPAGDQVWRGRTLGPAYRAGRVDAHAEFDTRQSFNAGQTADIAVVPTDGQALSLNVRDDSGHDICAMAPSEQNLGCTWVPSFTGSHEITVRNDNDKAARFYFVSN